MTPTRSSLHPYFALLSCLCATLIFSGCGDPAESAKGSVAKELLSPPPQKAIYLTARKEREPGTVFLNTATLTMADANQVTRIGDRTITGKVTTILRDIWHVIRAQPDERLFTVEQMSLTTKSSIEGGKPVTDKSSSTLTGIEFKVKRAGEESPWEISLEDQNLTNLQQVDMRMISDLWTDQSEKLYPTEPVELGQVWKPDPRALGAIVSPRLRVDEGEVTCKLEEITVLRGKRCGRISIDIDIAGKFEMAGSKGLDVQIALTGNIMRSLYEHYDMRTELTGSMQMEMQFPNKTISIDGVAEFQQKAEMEVVEGKGEDPQIGEN